MTAEVVRLHDRSCRNCGGTGTDDNDATCQLCDGTGVVEADERRSRPRKET